MEPPVMGEGVGGSGPSAKPLNVIFCDDVRREVTGKDILIGVYSADIVLPTVPVLFGVSLWIQFLTGGDGVVSAKLRITDPAGNTAGETAVEFPVGGAAGNPGGTSGAMALAPLAVSVVQAGAISVYWSAGGNDFTLIGQKRVKIGPVATVTAPPPAPRPPVPPA